MKKNKKLKFYQIEWIDAEDHSGWHSGPLPKAPHYISRGWLFKETEESYYLMATQGLSNNEYGTLMQIPKGMATKVEEWPKPIT